MGSTDGLMGTFQGLKNKMMPGKETSPKGSDKNSSAGSSESEMEMPPTGHYRKSRKSTVSEATITKTTVTAAEDNTGTVDPPADQQHHQQQEQGTGFMDFRFDQPPAPSNFSQHRHPNLDMISEPESQAEINLKLKIQVMEAIRQKDAAEKKALEDQLRIVKLEAELKAQAEAIRIKELYEQKLKEDRAARSHKVTLVASGSKGKAKGNESGSDDCTPKPTSNNKKQSVKKFKKQADEAGATSSGCGLTSEAESSEASG